MLRVRCRFSRRLHWLVSPRPRLHAWLHGGTIYIMLNLKAKKPPGAAGRRLRKSVLCYIWFSVPTD